MVKNINVIALPIPKNELTHYKDYIGFLFKNEDSVYNICHTEEDVHKSNQWFKNFPLKVIVVDDSEIGVGDKLFAQSVNSKLNNKVFTYLGLTEGGDGLIDIEDEKGEKSISTIYLLDSPKFLRYATGDELKQIVNTQSLNI